MTATGAPSSLWPTAFRRLPLGSVKPTGWLLEQLRLQASGLTGALEDIWPDVGPNSAWLGGDGEDWERGPYYLDGLVPLAHLLADERLLSRALRWVEAILGSQRPDGRFGPASNDDWWPRMVALKALTQHAEATRDPRVVPFMASYFRHQLASLPGRPLEGWGRVRGADNALSVFWLYQRTPEPWLVELAALLLSQTADWGAYFRAFPATGVTRTWDHMTHVVNVAMGLKTPAVRWLLDGNDDHRAMTGEGFANLDRFHGQVHGTFSGDEWLAGPDARRGVELCAIVELMFSLERLIETWGVRDHADRLERLAYNLLPAALSADMTAHQYHQQANQVLATIAQRDWTQAGDDCTIFGLEPNFGCCTANLHQGWPKLVSSMWMEHQDGGLVAVSHGPSRVRWNANEATVEIEASTEYPFDDTISYRVRSDSGATFALRLRIPDWCDAAEASMNGSPADARLEEAYLVIDRTWTSGDVVELRLPMRPRAIPRPRGTTGVALGPLVLAFSPGEVWERLPGSVGFGDWEVRPRRSWNVGLAIDEAALDGARVERFGRASPPFGLSTGPPPFGIDGVAIKAWLPGARIPDWRLRDDDALPPPDGPLEPPGQITPVPLVPYGSARVRISEFPTIRPVRYRA